MAQLDKLIRVVNVSHTYTFPLAGAPEQRTVYTYMIGRFGPFTRFFNANEDAEEKVSFELNQHVLKLRAMGALEPGT
jgi:hypothetical protein